MPRIKVVVKGGVEESTKSCFPVPPSNLKAAKTDAPKSRYLTKLPPSIRDQQSVATTITTGTATPPNMSSTPGVKPIPASKPATNPLPTPKPTEISHDQYSFMAANLHPAILLSGLLLCFNRLVQDPVSVLAKSAPIVMILQMVYCFLCLPSTGHAPPPPKNKWKKQARPTQDFGAKAVVSWHKKKMCISVKKLLTFRSSPPSSPSS